MITLKLDDDQISTLENALRVTREEYGKYAATFREQAHACRSGSPTGMFAEGEDGARAADRLAEQFDRQVAEVEAIETLIEESHEEED
jgi:hypothetical protein